MAHKDVQIILGVDPGTNVTGFGIIRAEGQKFTLLQYGVIKLGAYTEYERKLEKIFDKILSLIKEYGPDALAVEAPFYGKNPQSMLKLGRAQGVIIAAAISQNVPFREYAPKKIKSSVTGSGNASKEQVAGMLQKLLNFKADDVLLDATDALAVALCHHFQKGLKQVKAGNWKHFIAQNPNRVKK